MAQLVERVLGKDEVGGSNPPSSSKQKAPLNGVFFVFLAHAVKGYFLWFVFVLWSDENAFFRLLEGRTPTFCLYREEKYFGS